MRRGRRRAVLHAVTAGSTAALLLGFPLGFFQSGIIAGMGATFAELFPTRVRATGQGFSYNTGRAVGSLVPMVVGVLAADLGSTVAMGLRGLRLHARLIATSMLPETRGQELETGSSRTPQLPSRLRGAIVNAWRQNDPLTRAEPALPDTAIRIRKSVNSYINQASAVDQA